MIKKIILVIIISIFSYNISFCDIQSDKVWHLIGGYIATEVLIKQYNISNSDAYMTVMLLGIVKEIYDSYDGRYFDTEDIMYMHTGIFLCLTL